MNIMKKLTVLMGLMALVGPFNVMASTITLNISGTNADTAFKDLIAASDRPAQYGGTLVEITSNLFNYPGNSLYLSPVDGFTIQSVSTTTPGISEGYSATAAGYYSMNNGECSILLNPETDIEAVFDIVVVSSENRAEGEYPYMIPVVYSNPEVVSEAFLNNELLSNPEVVVVSSKPQDELFTLNVTFKEGVEIKGYFATYDIKENGVTSTKVLYPYLDNGVLHVYSVPYSAESINVNYSVTDNNADNVLNLAFDGTVDAYNHVTVTKSVYSAFGFNNQNISLNGENFTISLGQGQGMIFVKVEDGYEIKEYVSSANNPYAYNPNLISSENEAASLSSAYGVTVKVGDYYFSYNATGSNIYFENDVTLTFTVEKEGEQTGVETIYNIKGEDQIFNLEGTQIKGNNLKKGIYIINGKKVVVK